MSYKTGAFFDFDGTLADSLGALYQCYNEFVTTINGKPSAAEFQSLNGPPLATVVKRLCVTHKVPFSPQLIDDYNKLVDRIIEQCPPMTNADTVLKKAHELGFTCAIVTSNSRQRVENWILRNRLHHLIDFIIGGSATRHGKPAPAPYLLALDRAGVAPQNAIVFEDTQSGVISATKAGIGTLWISGEKEIKNIQNCIQIVDIANAVPHLERLALKANCK